MGRNQPIRRRRQDHGFPVAGDDPLVSTNNVNSIMTTQRLRQRTFTKCAISRHAAPATISSHTTRSRHSYRLPKPLPPDRLRAPIVDFVHHPCEPHKAFDARHARLYALARLDLCAVSRSAAVIGVVRVSASASRILAGAAVEAGDWLLQHTESRLLCAQQSLGGRVLSQ